MTVSPRAIFLPFEELGGHGEVPDAPFTSGVTSLARALATTLGSGDPPRACIALSRSRDPVIAVLGFFSSEYEERLARLWRSLGRAKQDLKYVGYGQAEEDAGALADLLKSRLGQSTLSTAQFVAIPRGGLIVLGMLSYHLDLNPHQLRNSGRGAAPLVIVDDCSLSGTRFRESLQQYPNASEVVFAHLYSPPALRRAIEKAEPRVSACLSAHDLHDRAPEIYEDEYPAWRARWEKRSAGQAYWNGLPDRVGFAWSEPDTNLWNGANDRAEQGWRVIPPERCLKNRIAFENAPPLYMQPESSGPLRPAPGVVFGPVGDHLLIAHPEAAQCFDLQHTARDMWLALVEHGTLETAQQALSKAYEVDGRRLRKDLEQFMHQLLENKLLVKGEAACPTSTAVAD